MCLSGFAQDLTPHFKKGESRRYQIKHTTKSPAQGPFDIFNTTKKVINTKIIDVQNNLITFEWTYLNVIFTDSIRQHNPIMDLMNTLTQGLTVKYTTDDKGVIKYVTNYQEISANIKQRIDVLMENMSKDKSIPSSLTESTRFQFDMMFSTEQQIDNIVISDVFKFHELYGHSFSPKSLIQVTDPSSDKYEVKMASNKNNPYRFEGVLQERQDSKRKGYRTYEFDPSYWPTKFIFKLDTSDPMSVSQYYEIKLTNN